MTALQREIKQLFVLQLPLPVAARCILGNLSYPSVWSVPLKNLHFKGQIALPLPPYPLLNAQNEGVGPKARAKGGIGIHPVCEKEREKQREHLKYAFYL